MTSNNEIIMNIVESYLIETNKKILKRHEEKHNVQVWIEPTKSLDEIIPHVDSVGNSGDRKEDLIEKVVHLLVIMTLKQPFYDGNKRTGVVSGIKLAYDNGYDLGIDPEADNSELREMLIKIKQHYHNLDMKIVAQMSFYISERIKPL